METRPCLFTRDGVVSDSAVVATLETASEVGLEHGCQHVDGPFRVTASGEPQLQTLDDEPAYDVYRRVVDANSDTTLTRENFFDAAKPFPFGLGRLDAEKTVRDPFENVVSKRFDVARHNGRT